MSETTSENPRPDRERSGNRGGCGRGLLLGIGILVVVGVAVFFAFVEIGQRTVDATREEAAALVRAFRPTEVISTFEEWRELEAEGNDGNILEIATATADETFSRKTAVAMFGKNLPLGTTVSEITVPATYRYHIDLHGDWFVTSDGNRLLVLAPPVEPSFPVAFDTGGMEKKTKSGWARWDGASNLEELEKSITGKLEQRAGDEEALQKARDAGRESVARFLRTWLLSSRAWGGDRFEEITVLFEGEKGKSLSAMPPTLRVDEDRVPEKDAAAGGNDPERKGTRTVEPAERVKP